MSLSQAQSAWEPQAALPASAPLLAPRVLFVASTRHHGGIEHASVRLAADLARSCGPEFSIAFACRPNSFTAQRCASLNIPILPYVVRNSADFLGILQLVRIILKHRPDIVHVHSRRDYLPAVIASQIAAKLGQPSLIFFHCHMIRSLGDPPGLSGAFFAKHVDRFLAVSHSVKQNLLLAHREIGNEQVTVLTNGVPIDHYSNVESSARQSIRSQYGIPDEALVIGMVGRLDAKGQKLLIDLAPQIKHEVNSPVRFLLVGSEGDPGSANALSQLAERQDVKSELILAGVQQDVAPYLWAMDIFVHLPWDEAFGLAIVEAMAAGLPVVASLAPGCREIVVNGETGYLADTQRPPTVLDAITKLANDPALRAQMGQAGQARAQACFSTERQIESLLAHYAEAVQSSSERGSVKV